MKTRRDRHGRYGDRDRDRDMEEIEIEIETEKGGYA